MAIQSVGFLVQSWGFCKFKERKEISSQSDWKRLNCQVSGYLCAIFKPMMVKLPCISSNNQEPHNKAEKNGHPVYYGNTVERKVLDI